MSTVRKFTRKLNKPRRTFKRPTLKRVNNKLNKLISRIEKKAYTGSHTGDCASDNSIDNTTKFIAVGQKDNERVGSRISCRNIKMRMKVEWLAGTGTTYHPVRMIVFYEKNSKGTAPTISDLLNSNTVTGMYNRNNEGTRFVILKDVMFHNPQTHSTIAYEKVRTFNIKHRKVIKYLTDDTTNATLGNNQVYVLIMSNVTIASGNAPQYQLNYRVYYTDD